MSAVRPVNLELEGVRGVACLVVALSHIFYVTPLDPTVRLPEWFRTIEAGHGGVLIFFMLSGYVIGWTNSGSHTPEAGRQYLWRRFIRLVPIYYVALALTAGASLLLHDQGQGLTLTAALFGLQNFNDYFGLDLNVPKRNSPLWSLNFELLYYLLFLLVWKVNPRPFWLFMPALIATVLAWFFPTVMPLFLGSYAAGWIFWAAGWRLARQPHAPAAARAPVLTWLLLTYAGHEIGGLTRVLNALGLHNVDSGMVHLGNLALFPPILLLLGAVTNRTIPFHRMFAALAWLFCLVPLAGMLWTGRLWAEPAWIAGGIAVLLAAAMTWVHARDWLHAFAWLGGISYAFYVVHFPLLFALERLPLPRGTLPAYFLRILVWAAISLGLAWWLEKRFQPWIKLRLTPLRPA